MSTIIAALRAGIGENQMMAYLVEMAVRLVELHRVLKPTGSIYLHCDPTASHYLTLLLDAVFGPAAFGNEIIWKRTSGHSDARRYGRVHDVILFYPKSDRSIWNETYQEYDPGYVDQYYRYSDADGRKFMSGDLSAAGLSGGGYEYEWKGVNRVWRVPLSTMEKLDADGRVIYTRNGIPRFKRYLDESKGLPAQDVWSDIEALRSWHKERLGWDTQKPLALLERIIECSSSPGDVVLDPFCGCGTALVAAQKLDRQWIGIDVTYLSIAVMKARLKDSFGLADIEVIGQPTEVEGARAMLVGTGLEGQYQFQWWALDLIGAQPQGGTQKKGADKGIDGVISFSTGPHGEVGRAIVSVKSGSVNSSMIRDLKGVLEREKAEIGLFVTLEEPSAPMRQEAAIAGVYHSELSGRDYQRIQVLSIKDIIEDHRRPDLPLLVLPAYQKAAKITTGQVDQGELFGS